MGVNDLAKWWHKYAWEQVPPEYAERELHGKYLRVDNQAGGIEDAADELESLARIAWHPVSEPPTDEDVDDHGMVLVIYADDTTGHEDWRYIAQDPLEISYWARIRDVVLLPPE